jgi:Ni,Fe-hydrogenase III component G
MTLVFSLEQLQTQCDIDGAEWSSPEPNRYDAVVSGEKLADAVKALKAMNAFYLSAITGLDDGVEKNTLHVLYHFCAGAVVVTLRVTVQRDNAVVPSICAIFPYASPFEREVIEMFGITFAGTPDTSRLYLPDDWTEGIYPMRKDAVIEEVHHDNAD